MSSPTRNDPHSRDPKNADGAVSPLTPLAFHILLALGNGDLHGYGIIKDIEARTDGAMTLRSGTLYTALQRLLEDGWITDAPAPDVDVDPRRRYYRISERGRAVAAAEAERLARLLEDARERRLAPGSAGA